MPDTQPASQVSSLQRNDSLVEAVFRGLGSPLGASPEEVQRIRDNIGDWDLNQLTERYSGLVMQVCRSHLGSAVDPTDASQAVWLRLTDHLDQLHNRAALVSWLVTTASRICLGIIDDRRQVLSGVGHYLEVPDDLAVAAGRELAAPDHDWPATQPQPALAALTAELPADASRLPGLLLQDPLSDKGIRERSGTPMDGTGPVDLVGGHPVATAELRSLGMREPTMCDPSTVMLLTRDVLARPEDPRRSELHRGKGSPAVRRVAGRWQVIAFDSRHPVTIADLKDLGSDQQRTIQEAARTGKPLPLEVLDAITVKQVAEVTPGQEFDAYDGNWVLLVRHWAAILTVKGQPLLTGGRSAEHANPPGQGYLYPLPTEEHHLAAVLEYLGLIPGGCDAEQAKRRRLALAFRYRHELLGIGAGAEESDDRVMKLFELPIQPVKTELRKRIWGRSGRAGRDSALLRYLLSHHVIGHGDVLDAEQWLVTHQGQK